MSPSARHLLFYDGVCGLCDRVVQFVLARDGRDRFRFAPLQGATAAERLARFDRDPRDLDTVYVLADEGRPTQRLLTRARAILFVLEELGGFWSWARIFRIAPTAPLDALYRFIARRRYRWFGRFDQCRVPDPKQRAKFIE